MMDIQGILKQLPHRYPFLLVDRVQELERNTRIRAIKNVTFNEPFFTGHFPGRPVMPGVLILEALAQAAGLLAFLLQADWRGLPLADCYLGVDDQPAPLHEVVDWLRAQLQVSTQLPAGLMRRAGNKRCSNQRLRALGWQPEVSLEEGLRRTYRYFQEMQQ